MTFQDRVKPHEKDNDSVKNPVLYCLRIGSILYVFHPAGSFMSGILQERYGRKRCMIFANVPSILGWIMLYRTNSSTMLYTSMVLMGMSIGFSEAPILSYVGEITEPRLRGSMSSLACMTSWIGCMLTFFLGYLFDWRTVALLSALCPVTCMCLVACVSLAASTV